MGKRTFTISFQRAFHVGEGDRKQKVIKDYVITCNLQHK